MTALLGTLAAGGEGKLRALGPTAVRVRSRVDFGEGTSRERLERLVAAERFDAAATLLAYALPEREAVWWGCMCVGSVLPPGAVDEKAALATAELWVRTPGRTTRHDCLVAGRVAGSATASAAVAFGAFKAKPENAHRSASGRWMDEALRRVLAPLDAAERDVTLRLFIGSACDIAAGGAGRIPARGNGATA